MTENRPKPRKLLKQPENLKFNETPLKPKILPTFARNLQNDRNTLRTFI